MRISLCRSASSSCRGWSAQTPAVPRSRTVAVNHALTPPRMLPPPPGGPTDRPGFRIHGPGGSVMHRLASPARHPLACRPVRARRMLPAPLLIAVAFGLVLLTAAFTAAEFSIVRGRAPRVAELAAEG